jgi:hypothetical protein
MREFVQENQSFVRDDLSARRMPRSCSQQIKIRKRVSAIKAIAVDYGFATRRYTLIVAKERR